MLPHPFFFPAVSPPLPSGWGQGSVVGSHNEAVFIRGTVGGVVDTVTFLHNTGSLCTLARNHTQCHTLLQCVACVNASDGSLLACYSMSRHGNDSIHSRCSLIGGEVAYRNFSDIDTMECSSFSSCQVLVGGDSGHGCSWCACSSIEAPACTSQEECLCDESCPSDICGYVSCAECVNDTSCLWHRSGPEAARCVPGYEESAMGEPLGVCPAPCAMWRSCLDCVRAPSPLQGLSECVWDSYTRCCASEVSLPLFCLGGQCGTLVHTPIDCPIGCSNRTSCDQCLLVPECVWLQVRGQSGRCTGVNNESAIFDGTSSPSAVNGVHYLECPGCGSDCGEHGLCSPDTLECDCDLGFVGEGCEVECKCNGHSNCLDPSAAGRRICTNCLDNTQVHSNIGVVGGGREAKVHMLG